MDLRDNCNVQAALTPKDLAAAAQAGKWISMKMYNHIEIYVIKAAGASGEPPTLTVEQGTDVSGTAAKALNFTRYTRRTHASDVTTIGTPTVTDVAAVNTLTLAAGNTEELLVFEFDASNLDTANSFDCLRVKFADVGATAQFCAIIYRLTGCKGDPKQQSAIVN